MDVVVYELLAKALVRGLGVSVATISTDEGLGEVRSLWVCD